MTRYPTFDEYKKRGNFLEGIRKCDQLLVKSQNDVALLTTKLQLILASKADTDIVLSQIHAAHPRDLSEIVGIEQAIVDDQAENFPTPRSAGGWMTKIWDEAIKSIPVGTQRVDALSLRFSRAITDGRLIDAQQAMVQLKAIQPRDRSVYMVHSALTQMISAEKNDLHARLAISLARKAVAENFDKDRNLDCRVPGQIFAIQESQGDLQCIRNSRFAESKTVYTAGNLGLMGISKKDDPTSIAGDRLSNIPADTARVDLQGRLAAIVDKGAPSSEILARAEEATSSLISLLSGPSQEKRRTVIDVGALCITSYVRLFELSNNIVHLIQAGYLAETILTYHKDTHEFKLILAYIYSRLGLGTLAMAYFESLSIKEIQFDTVGHILFGNLGLMSPLATSDQHGAMFDPWKRTAHALNMYVRHEHKLADLQADVLSHRQTGILFELQDLRERLRASVTRRTTLLDHRRISRLAQKGPAELAMGSSLGPRTIANWLTVSDNRDFDATFHYRDYNIEKVVFWQDTQGFEPALLLDLTLDTIWSFANELDPLVLDSIALVEQLDLSRLKPTLSGTPAQRIAIFATNVASILLQLIAPAIGVETDASTILTALVTNFHEQLSMDFPLDLMSSLTYIKPFYLYCDVLGCVSAAYTKLQSCFGEQQADIFAQLRKQIEQHRGKILEYVDAQRFRCSSSLAEELMAEFRSSTLEKLKGAQCVGVRAFCQEIEKSARAGWDGVARLKALQTK